MATRAAGLTLDMTQITRDVDGSASAQKSLFDLPPELQDMIFDYAYATAHDFKPVSKCTWYYMEGLHSEEYGGYYTKRPFPTPTVARFLVSKRFFLAAAKAFVSNQVMTHLDRFDLEITHAGRSRYTGNIFVHFMTKLVISLSYSTRFFNFSYVGPFLKEVEIEYSELQFDSLTKIKTLCPWEVEWTEDDIKAVAKHFELESLARFKQHRLVRKSYIMATSRDERELWSSNTDRLTNYVNALVEKERSSFATTGPRQATSIFSFSQHSVAAEMTPDQLPGTTEELIKLLKKDGPRVMNLIAGLKARESVD